MFLKAIFNRTIIKHFIKDRMTILAAYFTNTALIILFFYLLTDGDISVIYPMILSIFIFIIFMSNELYRYIRFNEGIEIQAVNPDYEIDVSTNEHKQIVKVINRVHSRNINKINDIEKEMIDSNRFLSQWIHDMKTPVSVIDLIIQKLKEKNTFNDEIIIELEEENNKILKNLEQTLTMIRLKEFSQDYVPEAIELNKLLKNIIRDNKKQFIYNNIFPKFNNTDNESYILSDVKWNRFMLEQIISNAIKYSSCKEQSKYIYFDIVEEGKYTILNIKDEGIGIPEYDINKIFEPFFTGENGRKYKNSTGIGLYICNMIAEKLEHDLSINSIKGEGTTVSIKYLSKL